MKKLTPGKILLIVLWTAFLANRLAGAFGVDRGLFLNGYFNDLIFVPAVLPVLIYSIYKLHYRLNPYPEWWEIALAVLIWAALIEGIGPLLNSSLTGDITDVLMYILGGILLYSYYLFTDRGEEENTG